jgi:RNA polymerase sigma-70 factor (ECF subfamily)
MTVNPLNFSFAFLADTLLPVRDEHVETADDRDIRATLAGDEDGYRRLVERHQGEIAKRLRKFSRDPRVLEELVHDTFVEAYFSLKRFRGEAPFIHWLHRIAVRAGYKYWKSRKNAAKTTAIDGHDFATGSRAARGGQADQSDTEGLEPALNQLSPRDRLVVTLMYLEERSVEETATLTGWSKTMVKVQAFRARGKLRKLMESQR